jgi:hypothetical protein
MPLAGGIAVHCDGLRGGPAAVYCADAIGAYDEFAGTSPG